MADINIPPIPPSIGEPIYLAMELSKLSPVPGDVLLVRAPAGASLEQVAVVLKQLDQILPDGVYVACIDSTLSLTLTNVPAVLAMLQKPDVTH